MAAKKVQKLMIGTWDDVANTFTPEEVQPETDLSDMTTMLAWARDNYGGHPGTYSFIRVVPGAMLVATQMVFNFVEEEGDFKPVAAKAGKL